MERSWTIAAVAFAVILGFALAFSVLRTRQAEFDDARADLTSLVSLLAEHGDRAIDDGDKLIRSVINQIRAWDLSEPNEARSIMESMRQLMWGSPQVASAWIMNQDGVSVLDTWTYPPTPIKTLERRYMRAHLGGEKGPFLAEQETGSLSKKPRFTVSRAVYDERGQLKAVVVAAIYSEYFSKLYSEAIRQHGARAGLYLKQPDGAIGLLARLGVDAPLGNAFLSDLSRNVSKANSGAVVINDRLAAWKALDLHSTAFASASIPLSNLDSWQRKALELGALYLFLTLTFVALLTMLRRVNASATEIEYREVMLAEVNHRVKNVMQILQAMIYARSRAVPTAETKAALNDLGASVTAFADLFATIQEDAATREIDLSAVLNRICASFEAATGRHIDCDIQPVILSDHAKATNISIIVNELITNAIKHSPVEVAVAMSVDDKKISVEISGNASDEPFVDNPKSSGFGTKMVSRLASAIGATISETRQGSRVSVLLQVPL